MRALCKPEDPVDGIAAHGVECRHCVSFDRDGCAAKYGFARSFRDGYSGAVRRIVLNGKPWALWRIPTWTGQAGLTDYRELSGLIARLGSFAWGAHIGSAIRAANPIYKV